MSGGTSSEQAIIDKAKSKGLVAIFPRANELFVDIDTNDDWVKFCEQFELLKKENLVTSSSWTTSKSGSPRKHVVVTMPFDVTEQERILMQAVLGSDRKREALNFIATRRIPDFKPTCFFEEPAKETKTSTFDIYGGKDGFGY